MSVALAEVGRRGQLSLVFASQAGKTILEHAYCEVPFKITRVLNSNGPLAHVMLMHCTAGLFGGDEIECSIRVERGARVIITQQSATKIHPSLGPPAIQRTHIYVDAEAELELYFEPIIPFAGSVLRQTTHVDVARGGRLVFWESFMAGRVGYGERWQFRELSCETSLRSDDRLVYLERFLLPNGLERSARVMGPATYMGTGLYVGTAIRDTAAALHEAIPEAGIDCVSSDVAAVRMVADAGPDLHRFRDIFRMHSSAPISRT
jgi:urease accessory protein